MRDRPSLLGDCQTLPFKDKIFDYVIASHVLEHTDNPEACLDELSRVSKRGYIETPSLLWEKLHPSRKYHQWFTLLIDDYLVFVRKNKEELNSIFGELFEIIASNSLEYHLMVRAYRKLFLVRHEWEEQINYRIDPDEGYLRSFFDRPWTMEQFKNFYPERSFDQQITQLGKTLTFSAMELLFRPPRRLIGQILKDLRKNRLNIRLETILACPRCKGEVKDLHDHIKCLNCDATYLYRRGIPDMVLENYEQYYHGVHT